MAFNAYNTDTLLNRVKRIESIPTAQNTFQESDIVDFLNMELQSTIVPLLISVNEEYFVFSQDNTVTANTTYLEIPSDAVGMKIRDAYWVDDSSGQFFSMPRLTPEQIAGAGSFGSGVSGYGGYYLQQNKLMLYPKSQGPGTIRINYFKRPNNLCLIEDSGEIVSINVGANTVELDNVPADWTVGTVVDFINENQPFTSAVTGATIVNIVGSDVEFSSSVIADLSVGMWAADTGTSPFPQYVPVESMDFLVQLAAMRCLEALGDKAGWTNAAVKAGEMEANLLTLVSPRVVGQPKKVVSGNGIIGAIRGGKSFWRG